jgi:hypothetical protein
MKIRTPNCECIVCEDTGRPVVRSMGPTTLKAIKTMRWLIDGLIAERDGTVEELLAKRRSGLPTAGGDLETSTVTASSPCEQQHSGASS